MLACKRVLLGAGVGRLGEEGGGGGGGKRATKSTLNYARNLSDVHRLKRIKSVRDDDECGFSMEEGLG